MSLVIAVDLSDNFIVASEGFGLRITDEGSMPFSDARKIYKIPNHPLIVAYVGVASIGKLVWRHASALSGREGPGGFIESCANYLSGLNDGLMANDREPSASRFNLSSLTGVLLAGFLHHEHIFAVIKPNGDILFPEHYAILGSPSAETGRLMESHGGELRDIDSTIKVCGDAIMQSSSEYSNEQVFFESVASSGEYFRWSKGERHANN